MKNIFKNVIFIFLVILLIQSCKNNNKNNDVPEPNTIKRGITYEIVIVDSCEYIMGHGSFTGNFFFTHKGNCKNPIHYIGRININYQDRVNYDTTLVNGK